MQIGFVTSEKIVVDGSEKTWFKMTLRAPYARVQDYKLVKRNKTKEGEPDYDIYLLVNNKGENFRNLKVGALWLKTSKIGDTYMSGHIESPVLPNGKIYITLTKARPLYEGESVFWKYDVLWSNLESKGYGHTQNKEESYILAPGIRVSEEEVPF